MDRSLASVSPVVFLLPFGNGDVGGGGGGVGFSLLAFWLAATGYCVRHLAFEQQPWLTLR
jgi:hypothetical protein